MTSSGASETERARKRTSGWSRRTASTTSWPPPPGRWTSSRTTSGSRSHDELDRRADVVGLADDLHRLTELGPDPGPEEVVVVDEEDPGTCPAGHTGALRCSDRAGSRVRRSSTSVPSPTLLRTTARPPRAGHPAVHRLGEPLPVRGDLGGVEARRRGRARRARPSRRSTSTKSETTGAPDHLAALTTASRPAASEGPEVVVERAVPDDTDSTGTPWAASTSRSTRRIAADRRPVPVGLGQRPVERARSAARAPGPGRAGRPAGAGRRGFWIRARVWRTESWTRAAMSARSSARTRAWRSTRRGPGSPSATTGRRRPRCRRRRGRRRRAPAPGSGRGRRRGRSRPRRRPPPADPEQERAPPPPGRSPSWMSGDAARPRTSRSSGPAFLHKRMPAPTPMNKGQASEPSQPSFSTEARTRMTTSSGARAAAVVIPLRSERARVPMAAVSPSRGTKSQPRAYAATPQPPARPARTKAIRTTVASTPSRTERPAATPPTRRSSRLRRRGPAPGGVLRKRWPSWGPSSQGGRRPGPEGRAQPGRPAAHPPGPGGRARGAPEGRARRSGARGSRSSPIPR